MRRPGTGCVTCRIRKIKCDERRPACNKCTNTGRKCDGYPTLPFTGRELHAASRRSGQPLHDWNLSPSSAWAGLERRLTASSTFGGVAEKRYFQFFRQCTIPSTSLMVDSRFWDRLVLQTCDAENAVKHAALAIAAYHSSIIAGTDLETAQHHKLFADKQYQLALHETNTLIKSATNKQVERVLIVCVLFIIYEGIQGDFAASQAHMSGGRAIAAQNRQGTPKNHEREIGEVFGRLDIFARTFSDAAAPYQYTLNDLLDTAPDFFPSPFANIRQAHASLIDLLRWMLVLGNQINEFGPFPVKGHDKLHYKAMLLACEHRLSEWHKYWLSFVQCHRDSLPNIQTSVVELWYVAGSTICAAGFDGPETRYDVLLDRFIRIVDLSETIALEVDKTPSTAAFSLDSGYMIPTWFCAVRCRDPFVRRRAIHVLKSCPRREGIWESTGAAASTTRWMQVEEEKSGTVLAAGDIPEAYRVALLDVQVDYRSSSATLHFTGYADKGSGTGRRTESLQWHHDH